MIQKHRPTASAACQNLRAQQPVQHQQLVDTAAEADAPVCMPVCHIQPLLNPACLLMISMGLLLRRGTLLRSLAKYACHVRDRELRSPWPCILQALLLGMHQYQQAAQPAVWRVAVPKIVLLVRGLQLFRQNAERPSYSSFPLHAGA
jgi:hypothetical protein